MIISNQVREESFHHIFKYDDVLSEQEEIIKCNISNLLGIVDYCDMLNEQVVYTEMLYVCEVADKCVLSEYLYGEDLDTGWNEDVRAALRELITKRFKRSTENRQDYDRCIRVSLGIADGAAHNMDSYLTERRAILNSITSVSEYFDFMKSCFARLLFAEDIKTGMNSIDFLKNKKLITESLAILNDKALELYKEYFGNLREAMRILSSKSSCIADCSNDSNHRDELRFPFHDDTDMARAYDSKMVKCETHLKLESKHSNLRIYFCWNDKDLGKGEKVLIGRIGGHPY